MNEETAKEGTPGDDVKIVTAKVKKNGLNGTLRYVMPSQTIQVKAITGDELKAHLLQNTRVILATSDGEMICDWYNCLTKESRLYPISRMLQPFKDHMHYPGIKVAIKHKGNVVGLSGLQRLERESRDKYAERVASRRRGVVPRRYIKVKCQKCGFVNEVDLVGFGNNEE